LVFYFFSLMSIEMAEEAAEASPRPSSPMLMDADLSAEEAPMGSTPPSPVSPQVAESPPHEAAAGDVRMPEKKRKTKEEREIEQAEREKRRKDREDRERARIVEKAERERVRKEKEEQREKEREERKRKLDEERELKERREKEREERKRKLEEERELKERREKEREEKRRRLDEEKEEKKRRLDEEKERKEKDRIEKLNQKEKERQEKEELRREEERRKEEEKLRLETKQKKMEITNFVTVMKKDAKEEQVAKSALGSALGPFAAYERSTDTTLTTPLRGAALDLAALLPLSHSHSLSVPQASDATSSTSYETSSSSSSVHHHRDAGHFWASIDLLAHWKQLPPVPPTPLPAVPGELPADFYPLCKVLVFHDSGRPVYFGTFQRRSAVLTGRTQSTSAADPQVDYEFFSEDEWEEEPADGEDVDDDRKSEVDPDDPDDEDAEDWCVEDGYFSEDEGLFRSGDEAEAAPPETVEDAADPGGEGQGVPRRRLRRRTKQPLGVLPPRVVGPVWSIDPEATHPLERFRAVNVWQARGKEELKCPLAALMSSRQVGKNGERELTKIDNRTPRKVVQERHMVDLIKLVHGATKLETAVKQFVERFPEDCSKAQTEAKMREISSREKVGKYLRWMVRTEVLQQHAPDYKPSFDDEENVSPLKPEGIPDANGLPTTVKLTPRPRCVPRKSQPTEEAGASKDERAVAAVSPQADLERVKVDHDPVDSSFAHPIECGGRSKLEADDGPCRHPHDAFESLLQPTKICFDAAGNSFATPSPALGAPSELAPPVTVLIPRRKPPS